MRRRVRLQATVPALERQVVIDLSRFETHGRTIHGAGPFFDRFEAVEGMIGAGGGHQVTVNRNIVGRKRVAVHDHRGRTAGVQGNGIAGRGGRMRVIVPGFEAVHLAEDFRYGSVSLGDVECGRKCDETKQGAKKDFFHGF